MNREPRPDELDEFENLFRQSRFGDEYARLADFSPAETWTSARARIAAGRLIGNIGATGRSRRLFLATWRREPADRKARYYVLLDYWERHGPLETLRLMDELAARDPALAAPDGTDDEALVWSWLLRARCLAQCRDFEAAEPWLRVAMDVRPNEAWTHVERANCLEFADRYTEALEAAEQALRLRPGYARAAWQVSHLLVLAGREDDALALSRRVTDAVQSGHIALQLGGMLAERDALEEALRAFELATARFPLAERMLAQFLASRRADLLYRLGRDVEAAEAAGGVRGRYWENFVARLTDGTRGRRAVLPVPFVRQHHMTCAPATLAAVSTYLGRPIDHLSLAQAITYDGTPDHEERHWLEAHGWHVREFRVTWDAARALLERQLPFTLVTTWTGSAHLQAVIGCDTRLGTLIIRDPYQREAHETLAPELLEQQAPFGPRGMVLVPAGEAGRLDGIELPDAAAYDDWYRLRRALQDHDRAAAAVAAERLKLFGAESRLALWAERQLAYYDDNPARALAAVERLRRQFPGETNLQLEEVRLLAQLGRRQEQRERIVAAMATKPDPAIWREQIELWRNDAREHRRALRLARRYARVRWGDWMARWTLAHVYWDAQMFEPALKLYRLAAATGDKVEAAWQSYFTAARHGGRGDEVLTLLERRVARLGASSAQPAMTLARALDQVDRGVEARRALERAIEQKPDDGELRVELALLMGRSGEAERAATEVERARARVSPADWHRAAATLAAWRADHAGALAHHLSILEENPLDVGSLRQVARLQAVTTGRPAALAWLAQRVAQYPHFLPLRELRAQWLRDSPVEESLAEVAAFLQLEPAHPWALREQALGLMRAGRLDEALASARLAETVEPGIPSSPGIVGQILLEKRELAGAREATERALRLDVGADWLMAQLLHACPEFEQRVAAVKFLRTELDRQAAPATGFRRFRDAAVGVLAPEELWRVLEELRQARPQRWEPWSAAIQQALALGRIEPAKALAVEATEKFPLIPAAWLDLADVYRQAGDVRAEETALGHAREISPGWRDAAFRLSSLLQRQLRPAEAVKVLERTLAHDPLDAGLRQRLAEALWQSGRQDEALAAVEQAAEAAPGWGEPWQNLADWSRERREPERVVNVARRVVASRAGDADARQQLARVLNERGESQAALAEAEAAVRLAPNDSDSHDLHACLLAKMGRREEALAACAPAGFGASVPHRLAGRAAWVRWVFGERKAAIEAMQQVTKAHPDYAWGWQILAEWRGETGDNAGAADAAQKYAELRPNDPVAWGWVAVYQLRQRDFAAAVPLLERALRLDPAYHYAAFQLLKVACEKETWDRAESALALIRQHNSRWEVLRCEIVLQCARRDREAAARSLRELSHAPAHEGVALNQGVQEMVERGWSAKVEEVLRGELAGANAHPETGALWMTARLRRRLAARPLPSSIDRIGAADKVRRTAWREYLEWLTQHHHVKLLRWHLWRRGAWLAGDAMTWGSVGYVLANRAWHRRLARWMADWRERPHVEPWMLSNLAHALRALGREAELNAVVAAALRLPADQTRASFVALAARGAAFAGDYASAARWLTHFEDGRKNAFSSFAALQAQAIADVAHATPAERAARWRDGRRRIAELRAAHPQVAGRSYIARDNRRALREAARLAQSPWRWWYALPVPNLSFAGSSVSAAGVFVALLVVVLAIGLAAAGAAPASGVIVLLAARALTAKSRQ